MKRVTGCRASPLGCTGLSRPGAQQESGPEKRRPVLRPFFAPQGRANPRGPAPSESSPHEVVFVRVSTETSGSSAGRWRGKPRLHILPSVSKVTPNTMRARPLPLVAPRVQRLDRDLKVGGYLGWRGQTPGPPCRLCRFISHTTRHRGDEGSAGQCRVCSPAARTIRCPADG